MSAFCEVSFAQVNQTTMNLDSIHVRINKYRDFIIKESHGFPTDSLVLLPVVKLRYSEVENSRSFLEIDSLSEVIAIYPKRKNVYVLDIGSLIVSQKGQTKQILDLISTVKAEKRFFAFFLDADRHNYNLLAFSLNDNILFLTNKTYQSVRETINEKFGNLENYNLYRDSERVRIEAIRQAALQFNDFSLRDNWQFYSKYHRTDTLNNISLLLGDVRQATSVNRGLLDTINNDLYILLKDTVAFNIEFNDSFYRDSRYHTSRFILFMEKDISKILRNRLGPKLYRKYYFQLKIGEKLCSLMEGSLSTRFKGNWSEIRKFAKTKVEIVNKKPFRYSISNEERNPVKSISMN